MEIEPRYRGVVSFSATPSGLFPCHPHQGSPVSNVDDTIKVDYCSNLCENDQSSRTSTVERPIASTKVDKWLQLKTVASLQQCNNVAVGDVVFLLSRNWWDLWIKYLTQKGIMEEINPYYPPMIDNLSIIDSSLNLNKDLLKHRKLETVPEDMKLLRSKHYYDRCRYAVVENLIQDVDFVVVLQETWEALSWWFGGGPPIPRIVVEANSQLEMGKAMGKPLYLSMDKGYSDVETKKLIQSLQLSPTAGISLTIDIYPTEIPSIQDALSLQGTAYSDLSNINIQPSMVSSRGGNGDREIVGNQLKRFRRNEDTTITTDNDNAIAEETLLFPLLQFRGMNFNDCGSSAWDAALKHRVAIVAENMSNDIILPGNSCFTCRRIATHRCSRCKAVYYCCRQCQESHWPFHRHWCQRAADIAALPSAQLQIKLCVGKRGNVGLHNLGNSCYMNSCLQCISHIVPLTTFFLSERYLTELNKTSLDGTGGKLAMEYGSLLRTLWFDHKSSVSPSRLKHQLGKVRPEYAGFQQHDAHELIELFLDKLHEDLNRIKKKPYTERPEGDGTNDSKIAEEAWNKHSMRESSIISDIAGSLMRSQLTCLVCGKVSVCFEYQQTVQVPIPRNNSRVLKVLFIPQSDVLAKSLSYQAIAGLAGNERECKIAYLKRREALQPVVMAVALDRLSLIQALKVAVNAKVRSMPILDASGVLDGGEEECDTPGSGTRLAGRGNRRRSRSGSISIDGKYAIGSTCLLELGGPHQASVTRILRDDDSLARISPGGTVVCYATVEKLGGIVFLLQRKIWQYSASAGNQHPDYDVAVNTQVPPSRLHYELSGLPVLLSLDMKWSCSRVRMLVWQQVSRFVLDSEFIFDIDGADDNHTKEKQLQAFRKLVLEAELTGNVAKQLHLCKLLPLRIVNGMGEGLHSVMEGRCPVESSLGMLSDGHLGPEADHFLGSSVPFDNSISIGEFLELAPSNVRVQQIRFLSVDWSGSWLAAVVAEVASTYLSVHPSCDLIDGFSRWGVPFTLTALHSLNQMGSRGSSQGAGMAVDGKPPLFPSPLSSRDNRSGSFELTASSALGPQITLEQCLREHTREEELDDTNAWYCSQCKQHQRAKKIVRFWGPSLPQVLILVLKRFEFRDVSMLLGQAGAGFTHREKICAKVDFPVSNLDVASFCSGLSPDAGSTHYDLFAVCNHFGRLGSGHYTAMARDWRGAGLSEAWFNFDDDEVQPIVDDSKVVTDAAYILFYRRRNDSG